MPRSSGGRSAAIWSALKPPQDLPISPTAPVHQGCDAPQRIASTPSACSSGRYSSRSTPSDSPEPRRSMRKAAMPWPANQRCIASSRSRVPMRFPYGMYSMTAGTGVRSAVAGSHRRAARRQPSLIGIHACSISRTALGKSSTTFKRFSEHESGRPCLEPTLRRRVSSQRHSRRCCAAGRRAIPCRADHEGRGGQRAQRMSSSFGDGGSGRPSPTNHGDPAMSSKPMSKEPRVDMKLEVVILPVSDVDRAKRFYEGLGWRLDGDFSKGDGWRALQLTPPGSPCSVVFGKGITSAAPGSVKGNFLVVDDIEDARSDLADHGVDVSEVFHFEGGLNVVETDRRVPGPDPEGRSYSS